MLCSFTQTNLLQVSPPFHSLSVPSRKAGPVATELRNMSLVLPQALSGPAAQLPQLSFTALLKTYWTTEVHLQGILTSTLWFIEINLWTCIPLGTKMVEPDPSGDESSLSWPLSPLPADSLHLASKHSSHLSQEVFLTFFNFKSLNAQYFEK